MQPVCKTFRVALHRVLQLGLPLVLIAHPVGAVASTVVDLGPAPAVMPEAARFSINEAGDVAGVSAGRNGMAQAFLYRRGQKRSLGTLRGCAASYACGINNRDEVVGFAMLAAAVPPGEAMQSRAFLYRTGMMKPLPGAKDRDGEANGINDRGQVVGRMQFDNRVYAFTETTGKVSQILDDGLGSLANAVNHGGTVAGVVTLDTTWHSSGALWQGGKSTLLDQYSSRDASEALAINDRGQVVGWAASPYSTGVPHAFLWQGGTMSLLKTPGAGASRAYGINNRGDVVGEIDVPASAGHAPLTHAVLWKAGKIADLNALIRPGSGWVLTRATGINSRGEIVGVGLYHGKSHGFLFRR